ncbi:hypothetical protein N9917_03190 [Deltaproteobacteria bacterium]|nr:hypothetical protein [Deltaproteobacteria bacterium]
MSDLNLDAMERDDLMAFWAANRSPSYEQAQAIVGDVPDPVSVVELLGAYAVAKACAIKLRLEGEIARAMIYEQHCDIYYADVPEAVRW